MTIKRWGCSCLVEVNNIDLEAGKGRIKEKKKTFAVQDEKEMWEAHEHQCKYVILYWFELCKVKHSKSLGYFDRLMIKVGVDWLCCGRTLPLMVAQMEGKWCYTIKII